MTKRLEALVHSCGFQWSILAVIVFAAILIGLETSPAIMERYGKLLHSLDAVVLLIFILEAAAKMGQHGRRFWRYFLDGWNVFDFMVIVVCLLLALLFYVYAVVGVFLWRGNDPVHFGDLPTAMLTLFRVVTLEDWTDVMYIQMKGSAVYGFEYDAQMQAHSQGRPILAVIYFVSFVLFGTMVMLNLFIGVIVNSMNEAQAEREMDRRRLHLDKLGRLTLADEANLLEEELARFQDKLRDLRRRIGADRPA